MTVDYEGALSLTLPEMDLLAKALQLEKGLALGQYKQLVRGLAEDTDLDTERLSVVTRRMEEDLARFESIKEKLGSLIAVFRRQEEDSNAGN